MCILRKKKFKSSARVLLFFILAALLCGALEAMAVPAGHDITLRQVQDDPRKVWAQIKVLSQYGLPCFLSAFFVDRTLRCPALPLPVNAVKIGAVTRNQPKEARSCH